MMSEGPRHVLHIEVVARVSTIPMQSDFATAAQLVDEFGNEFLRTGTERGEKNTDRIGLGWHRQKYNNEKHQTISETERAERAHGSAWKKKEEDAWPLTMWAHSTNLVWAVCPLFPRVMMTGS